MHVKFGGCKYISFLNMLEQLSLPKERRIITRMLQLQATVKRFQFDLYVNLEGQHVLISSWSQK